MKDNLSLLLNLEVEARLDNEGEKVKRFSNLVLGNCSCVITYLNLILKRIIPSPTSECSSFFAISDWTFLNRHGAQRVNMYRLCLH